VVGIPPFHCGRGSPLAVRSSESSPLNGRSDGSGSPLAGRSSEGSPLNVRNDDW